MACATFSYKKQSTLPLEYIDGLLPISGRDVMARFHMPPGPQVGAALRVARELFAAGTRGKEDLMAALRERLADSQEVSTR